MVTTIAPLVKVAPMQWLASTTIFVVASTTTGAAAGWLVGATGRTVFGAPTPQVGAWWLAGIALTLAVLDSRVFGGRVPTFGGSVPRSWWERYGPSYGSLMYGAVLGLGISTVVPVASFYLLPLGAFLLGPDAGLVIGAAYGFARALAVPFASAGQLLGVRAVVLTDWLLRDARPMTNSLSAVALITLAATVIVAWAAANT